ncbi:dirigent protein 17-like isoform X2 [Arachis stenosperma]|uniref:dirigent protein 17-like isoform X2 n=1 Tax=Arachis stenosperma TaxID=217475 RepID=UPI0025AC60CB|nr:dirigent protein 17-like isoform X2 [Arachis stenosperma]
MEEKGNEQGSNVSAAGVFEIPGEPAIVINGVPEITPSEKTDSVHNASGGTVEKEYTPLDLGEWFEGREVRKWFMGRYYSGTVMEFDKQTGWYRVLYEDGDSEDLDWHELEGVLVPLDVTTTLKALAQRVVKKGKKYAHKSGKTAKIKRRATKGKPTLLMLRLLLL